MDISSADILVHRDYSLNNIKSNKLDKRTVTIYTGISKLSSLCT